MGNISSCCDKPQPGERSEEPSAPQEVIISTSNSPLKPEDAPAPSQAGVRLNGAVVTGAGDELMEKLGANYIRQQMRLAFGSSTAQSTSESQKLAVKGADPELKDKLTRRRPDSIGGPSP